MTHSLPDDPLTPLARRCLVRGLAALDTVTEAPLRLRGHVTGQAFEVFDVQEEFELGPSGRRFLISVDGAVRDAMLVSLGESSRGSWA